VETLADLRPDMTWKASSTNVAAFGAFVDIGVHQEWPGAQLRPF